MTEKEIRERERREGNKKAVRLKKRRRLITTLISLCVVFAVLFCVIILGVFRVEDIVVSGNTLYSYEQIIEASGIKKGDNLIFLSGKDVDYLLKTKLPYIEGVTVEKKYPRGITISVTETSEKYCFYKDGTYFTADGTGKILRETKDEPQNLPIVVSGESFTFALGHPYKCEDTVKSELTAAILKFMLEKEHSVNLINLTDIYDCYVVFDGNTVVKLGSSAYLERKLDFLAATLKDKDKLINGELGKGKGILIDLASFNPDKDEVYASQKNIDNYLIYK